MGNNKFVWLTPSEWCRNDRWHAQAIPDGYCLAGCEVTKGAPFSTESVFYARTDKRFLDLCKQLPKEVVALTECSLDKLKQTPPEIELPSANYPPPPSPYTITNKRYTPKPTPFWSWPPHVSKEESERFKKEAIAEMEDFKIQGTIHQVISLARWRHEWNKEHSRLISEKREKEERAAELLLLEKKKREEQRRLKQEENRKRGLIPYMKGNSTIYIGINLGTQKAYIGKTERTPKKRWEEHKKKPVRRN